MADLDYDQFDGGYLAASGRNLGRYTHLVGAAVSIALVLGGVVWGYRLAVRDVTGVPVFRAVAGPMRLAPSEPGGAQTQHQGLSVNAVAAVGTALPLPETLMLAPKAEDLAEEDLAGLTPLEPLGIDAGLVTMSANPAPQMQPGTLEVAPAAVPTAAPEALPQTQEDAVAAALAEALGLDAPQMASETTAAPTLRPKRRPGAEPDVDLGVQLASLDNQASSFAATLDEIDPATIAPGTILVQLGAYPEEALAREEWARLSVSFTDLMGGKALVIQPAQSGGKTFYRLRAHGFGTDDDARHFCTAMLAENATCIPVAQR